MSIIYSVREAKARFAEVLRHARDGEIVTVSYRGEPVAEVRPLPQSKVASMTEDGAAQPDGAPRPWISDAEIDEPP